MKIYETKSPAEGHTSHYGGYSLRSNMICELGNDIKLFNQLHTKDTLAPIFGKALGFYGSSTSVMLLHNSIQKSRDYEDATDHHVDLAFGADENFVGTSNRQLQMAGLSMTRMWRSTYDTTKIYFTSKYNYDHGYSYNYEYDVTTNTFTNFLQVSTHMGSIGFIYEDDDYIWGVDNGGDYLYNAYSGLCRVNKATLAIERAGMHDRTTFARPLYWNDEYIITFWDDGNYSSGHPSRSIHLNKWNDTFSNATALKWKDQAANHWNYPFLEMQQSDGTKARNLIYHVNTLTDDTQSKAGGSNGSRPHWAQPAIVHDNAANLRDTHKVIRTYHAERCAGGVLGIIRCNIPLLDHANAFNDASDGRPGGKAYGTNENPTYDIRNCNISALAGFSTPLTESNMFGNNGLIYNGSTSHVYKTYNLSFFEDSNGKGFLILDFASPNVHMHDSGATYRAQSIWVFEIENYAASITDELWETNSLDLKIIQEIDTGDDSYGLYRPSDDPETFIAMSWRNNSHKIYTWNSSSKQFTTGSELKGQIEAIGNDSNGNIYTIKARGGNRNYEIHTESPTLPNQIIVTPANDRYTFTGATISSTVDIECFNYAGDRIAATVNLQMIGEGVIFTSSSATSAGKALTITTSSSAAVTENISITQATFVKINASMSV